MRNPAVTPEYKSIYFSKACRRQQELWLGRRTETDIDHDCHMYIPAIAEWGRMFEHIAAKPRSTRHDTCCQATFESYE